VGVLLDQVQHTGTHLGSICHHVETEAGAFARLAQHPAHRIRDEPWPVGGWRRRNRARSVARNRLGGRARILVEPVHENVSLVQAPTARMA
jgi:hypothetical protein